MIFGVFPAAAILKCPLSFHPLNYSLRHFCQMSAGEDNTWSKKQKNFCSPSSKERESGMKNSWWWKKSRQQRNVSRKLFYVFAEVTQCSFCAPRDRRKMNFRISLAVFAVFWMKWKLLAYFLYSLSNTRWILSWSGIKANIKNYGIIAGS